MAQTAEREMAEEWQRFPRLNGHSTFYFISRAMIIDGQKSENTAFIPCYVSEAEDG